MNKSIARASCHSLVRMKERFGVKNPRSSARIVSLAFERGSRMSEFRSKYERSYLEKWCRETNVEPVIYQEFVFIFNLQTKKCITVYPVPAGFESQRRKTAKTEKHAKHTA